MTPHRHPNNASCRGDDEYRQEQDMVSTDRTLQWQSDGLWSRGPVNGAACPAAALHTSLAQSATGSALPPTLQPPSAPDTEPCLEGKADPLVQKNMGISSHATQGRMASLVSRFRTAPPRPRLQHSATQLTSPGALEDQQLPGNESLEAHHMRLVGAAVSTVADAVSSSPCQTAPATCVQSNVPRAQIAASSDGRPSHVSVKVHTESQLLTRPPRRSCRPASQRSQSTDQCAVPHAVGEPVPAHPHARSPVSQQNEKHRDSAQGCAARLEMSLIPGSDAVNPPDCGSVPCAHPLGHTPKHDSVARQHVSLLQQDLSRRNCHPGNARQSGFEDGADDDPVTQLLQRCHRVLDARHRPSQAAPAALLSAADCSNTSEYVVLHRAARSLGYWSCASFLRAALPQSLLHVTWS